MAETKATLRPSGPSERNRSGMQCFSMAAFLDYENHFHIHVWPLLSQGPEAVKGKSVADQRQGAISAIGGRSLIAGATALADAEQLVAVAAQLEAMFHRHLLLQFLDLVVQELDHQSAALTHQVIVVLAAVGHLVERAALAEIAGVEI